MHKKQNNMYISDMSFLNSDLFLSIFYIKIVTFIIILTYFIVVLHNKYKHKSNSSSYLLKVKNINLSFTQLLIFSQ